MGAKFWVKRGVLVLAVSFLILFLAKYFKSNDFAYALGQAMLWSVVTTMVYLLVLWNKLRKNPSCAAKQSQDENI